MTSKISVVVTTFVLMANVHADESRRLWPDNVASPQTKNIAPVSSLVEGLARRLHENPDDAGGWLLLAQSYRHLGRRSEARTAYAKAAELGKADAGLEAWLAEDSAGVPDIDIVRNWLMSE